jgi:RecA/RadA recombinase
MIPELIYKIVDDEDFQTLFSLKDKMFTPQEWGVVEFLQDHYRNYSTFPDQNTIHTQTGFRTVSSSSPVQFWVDRLTDAYKEKLVEEMVLEAAQNPSKAVSIFQQGLTEYQAEEDMNVVIYSDSKSRYSSYKNLKKTGIAYVSTGSQTLDNFCAGFKRGDLWSIGGPEGIGKTWYLCQFANWFDEQLIYMNLNRNVLFVSCEVDDDEIQDRFDSIKCKLDYGKLIRGQLTKMAEKKYERFLKNVKTNLIITDSVMNIDDLDYLIMVYNPIAVFLDGAHLMASDYDWKTVAKLTADLKRRTRKNKIPIVCTTHTKAGEGNDIGGTIDSFAYSKGFTRDSDVAAVMYRTDMMQLEDKIGVDFVKIRRGERMQIIYKNNFTDMSYDVDEVLVGNDIIMNQLQPPGRQSAGSLLSS